MRAIVPFLAVCFTLCLTSCFSAPPGEGGKARAGYRDADPVISSLDRFHQEHGHYPADLSELVPAYLKQLPQRRFAYRRDGDAFSLVFSYTGPGMNMIPKRRHGTRQVIIDEHGTNRRCRESVMAQLSTLSFTMRFALFITLLLAASGCTTPKMFVDWTVGTSSICELHHVQMVRERVSLYCSGFGAPYHDYSLCPHAKRPIDTGCSKYPNGDYGFIWVCPECERVYKQQKSE
jgi:hypothetical protein